MREDLRCLDQNPAKLVAVPGPRKSWHVLSQLCSTWQARRLPQAQLRAFRKHRWQPVWLPDGARSRPGFHFSYIFKKSLCKSTTNLQPHVLSCGKVGRSTRWNEFFTTPPWVSLRQCMTRLGRQSWQSQLPCQRRPRSEPNPVQFYFSR